MALSYEGSAVKRFLGRLSVRIWLEYAEGKMCSSDELNSILRILAETYRSVYGRKINRIVLYGSYARGDYAEDSDIDVAAIVEGSRESLQKELYKIWDISAELEVQYGIIVSPTVIPLAEFEQYKDTLAYYQNIVKEGIPIAA